MAAYSSSTSNSNTSLLYKCSNRVFTDLNTASMTMKATLTLPLYTLVLYLGHQRWRQQRSFKPSHSDIFTYHMAAMNLIWLLGCFCLLYGTYANILEVAVVGGCAVSIIRYGETLFHVLTCLEQYLAVVHPIAYMGLKNVRGARIRNISIGCVWLLSFAMIGVSAWFLPELPVIQFFCFVAFSLTVACFCSLSVLCVLIRPGPGDRGGKKMRVDQSKRRALHTITAILGVLCLLLVSLTVGAALYTSPLAYTDVGCAVIVCSNVFNLPSSLLFPLLYLNRAGKLPCC